MPCPPSYCSSYIKPPPSGIARRGLFRCGSVQICFWGPPMSINFLQLYIFSPELLCAGCGLRACRLSTDRVSVSPARTSSIKLRCFWSSVCRRRISSLCCGISLWYIRHSAAKCSARYFTPVDPLGVHSGALGSQLGHNSILQCEIKHVALGLLGLVDPLTNQLTN